MICLALDTSSTFCSVAVYDAQHDKVLYEISEDLGRGHAERLIGAIEECLAGAGVYPVDLSRIISSVGPGSFTGVRVGLATARGLALGWGVPVVGVSNLLALEQLAFDEGLDGALLTAIDARRGELFARFSHGPIGKQVMEDTLMPAEQLASTFAGKTFHACGSGAPILAERLGPSRNMKIIHTHPTAPIAIVARIGSQMCEPEFPPEPLYLRSADAKSQSGFAVALKS